MNYQYDDTTQDPYGDYHRELFSHAENDSSQLEEEQRHYDEINRQYIEEALEFEADWESLLLAAMIGGAIMGSLLYGRDGIFLVAGISGALWVLGRCIAALRG